MDLLAYERIQAKLDTLLASVARIESRMDAADKLRQAVRLEFYIEEAGQLRKVTDMIQKVSQKAKLALVAKDKFGNVAAVDGAPQWALSAPALGSLNVAEDGMSAEFVPAGPVGSLEVQVTADADLGEGVKAVVGSLPVDLVAGDAVSVELAATLEDLPEA